MSNNRTITILRLIRELLAFMEELNELNEEPTDEEILKTQQEIKEAVKKWK